jgi:hypothetical protein
MGELKTAKSVVFTQTSLNYISNMMYNNKSFSAAVNKIIQDHDRFRQMAVEAKRKEVEDELIKQQTHDKLMEKYK